MTKVDLDEIAEQIANDTAHSVNVLAPATVDDMPYARQYTLEKVIEALEALV